MTDKDNFSLETLTDSIKKNDILLPDFQRSFVWRQEERQKLLISSVLAKMPIGSILLLEGDSNEFAVRKIGMKDTFSMEGEKRTIDYLLDGQQRITVLTCAFSDVINDIEKSGNQSIISPSLQRRFFLKFPKYKELSDDAVYFGAKRLRFPQDLNKADVYPDFIAEEIMKQIECRSYSNKKNLEEPYHPYFKPKKSSSGTKELIEWCMKQDEFYIPLYLITKEHSKFTQIIKEIAEDYRKSICCIFNEIETVDKKKEFAKDYLIGETYDDFIAEVESEEEEINTKFEDAIIVLENDWKINFDNYLVSCVAQLNKIMTIIEVKKSQRERAIDIYENLNKGGVSLSIFDLIVARASLHDQNKEFIKEIGKIIDKSVSDVIPLYNCGVTFSSEPKNIVQIGCTYLKSCGCSDKENDFNSKFIDVFLNVLSLYANSYSTEKPEKSAEFDNGYLDLSKITIDNTKRKAKLNLDKDQIYINYKLVCTGIDRALYFFKNRCGISAINNIPYNHVLSIVSLLFISNNYFNDSKVHELLEAWYWSIMFSGEFDKDQNTKFIYHLTNLITKLPDYRNSKIVDWIKTLQENVFKSDGFSDKDRLLMKDEEAPKGTIKNAILQYYLSKYYNNFSTKNSNSPYNVKISAYTDEVYTSSEDRKKYKLQIHHIIPLNTMEDYESGKREDSKFYGNSPINLIYIVAEDNNDISDDDVESYLKIIDQNQRQALDLFSDNQSETMKKINKALLDKKNNKRTRENVLDLLELRFELMAQSINREINELLKFPAPTT